MDRIRKALLSIFGLVLIMVLPMAASACTPSNFLRIRNETGQALSVSLQSESSEVAQPLGTYSLNVGREIYSGSLPSNREPYLLEARNEQGNIVFQKLFSW
jgi:hypothetical protein